MDPPLAVAEVVDPNEIVSEAALAEVLGQGDDLNVEIAHLRPPQQIPGSIPQVHAGVPVEFDDELGDADEQDLRLAILASTMGHHSESVSPCLYQIVQEDNPQCPSWWTRSEGCSQIVDYCKEHPDEALHVSMSGRTPLHEACLRGSCTHIIAALLEVCPMSATYRDNQGNTPLHLLFVDYSTRSILDPFETDRILESLLKVSRQVASISNLEGSTALHMACMASPSMILHNSIKRLLDANPASAATPNNRNQTALRLHCEQQHAGVEKARMLYSASPEALLVLDGDTSMAPLHCAAANANVDLIKFLVEANPGAACVRTAQGKTPLHLLCARTITPSKLEAVDLLLQTDPDSVVCRDLPGLSTPLHVLCREPRVSLGVVKRMLDTRPESASLPDSESYLPLHHACEVGCDAGIVGALLRADPSAARAMTRKQDSALSLACTCNQSIETVHLLIQANMDALVKKNDYGFAPLHCVCRAYQPRMGIVQALLDACPSCINLKTHGGETPVHLASSNSGAFVGVLQLLTRNQRSEISPDLVASDKQMTNKIGNTPLHDACFRGSSFEHIETLAIANPEWITVRNNAGYSPLQIICKNGRVDERIVTTFSRIGGPEIFSVIDSNGYTPLHSAIRGDMELATLKCLIRALPGALHLKTVYGDTALHLACFRRSDPAVVREIALASSTGRISPVLETNSAGQTPIGIAMDEFRSACRGSRHCCVISEYRPEQQRVFHVLATLVKILYYGANYQDEQHMNLVRACVALHRQNIRLDPSFIRRAIHMNPEEVRVADEEGNYPLHIEASIPIEKMALLDSSSSCCAANCHKRVHILRILLEGYPKATETRNKDGQFPLNLMIQSGRIWGNELVLALRAFPPALSWQDGLDDKTLVHILGKVSNECGVDTLYTLLTSRPELFREKMNLKGETQTAGA